MPTRLPLLALAAALLAAPAAAQEAADADCPCASYGPYPCAAVTLVALADQAAPLGLTGAQLVDLQPIRDRHLRLVHEIEDDIASLKEALHRLDRPFEAAEAFALFYDLGRHEAELEAAFAAAEAEMLDVLDARQRRAWHAVLDAAAALQETPPEASGAPSAASGGPGSDRP